jgi:hypothetical protein
LKRGPILVTAIALALIPLVVMYWLVEALMIRV